MNDSEKKWTDFKRIERQITAKNDRKKIVVLGNLTLNTLLADSSCDDNDLEQCKTGSMVGTQAIACARLLRGTHDIEVLGHVGTDNHSAVLVDLLEEKGVQVKNIVKSGEPWTGCLSTAQEHEEFVVTGELDLCPEWKAVIESADTLLLQREIPTQIAILASRYARSQNCKVVLEVGDSTKYCDRELLENVDVYVPNAAKVRELSDASKSSPAEVIAYWQHEYPGMDVLY